MPERPKQIREWVHAVEAALSHAADIAATAARALEGEEGMVFDLAAKTIRNLSGHQAEIEALGRLSLSTRPLVADKL